MALQNLINQLMQPMLGEDRPSTIKRRAAEALTSLSSMQQADLQGRLAAERDNRQLLELLTKAEAKLEPSNHAEVYNEVMNKEYYGNVA